MNSLWKDLLFLHGYMVRKEDLLWHDQTAPESTAETPTADYPAGQADAELKSGAKPPKCHAAQWPRLAAPR